MTTVWDLLFYIDDALDQMVAIVVDLGDEKANLRLDVPGSNSPYAILTHCLGVMEFWGGCRIRGRRFERDRAAEFVSSGSVSELADRAVLARRKLASDLEGIDASDKPEGEIPEYDLELPLGKTKGGVLVHIYEELAQHRGQMEVTRDLILSDWARFA